MTELSFMIELLLNHKLPKVTKELIVARIKEIEEKIEYKPAGATVMPVTHQSGPVQAASTLALMAKHGEIPMQGQVVDVPAPPVQAAQNPVTAAAMQARQESIAAALSGKVDKVSGRPRKW